MCSSKLTFSRFLVASCIRAPNIELKIENMKVKKRKKCTFCQVIGPCEPPICRTCEV